MWVVKRENQRLTYVIANGLVESRRQAWNGITVLESAMDWLIDEVYGIYCSLIVRRKVGNEVKVSNGSKWLKARAYLCSNSRNEKEESDGSLNIATNQWKEPMMMKTIRGRARVYRYRYSVRASHLENCSRKWMDQSKTYNFAMSFPFSYAVFTSNLALWTLKWMDEMKSHRQSCMNDQLSVIRKGTSEMKSIRDGTKHLLTSSLPLAITWLVPLWYPTMIYSPLNCLCSSFAPTNHTQSRTCESLPLIILKAVGPASSYQLTDLSPLPNKLWERKRVVSDCTFLSLGWKRNGRLNICYG